MEESAIPKRDFLPYIPRIREEESFSDEFSEHSDLEPFLMTAVELENQYSHYLRYRQKVHRREWLKKPV